MAIPTALREQKGYIVRPLFLILKKTMKTKLIRGIPDKVFEKLKSQAKKKGLNLTAYIMTILYKEIKI